ncbi:MAG: hypothetical protein AAFQ80_18005 [Cyanobacteria bacterium J06621_8]
MIIGFSITDIPKNKTNISQALVMAIALLRALETISLILRSLFRQAKSSKLNG